MKNIDYSLYLVTDRPLCLGRDLIQVVKEAVAGGVTLVQLREKNASTREFLEIAVEIRKILQGTSVPLIINDRIDIALALNAEGVHLGNSDMPYEKAREILGQDKIIGLSAESVKDAMAASRLGADYLGVSPIFTTPTKSELETGLGLEGLREIRRVSELPLVAIGGMNVSNCRAAVESGADGIAVVSALCSVPDPGLAARALLSEVKKGKQKRNEA
jgi:thiamine-phosphate pyrophosphorylase